MRIGIVSDLHGNAAGLAAAVERLGAIDELWCAGDIVDQSWFSNETVALLRELDARCVLGNHDAMLLSRQGVRAREAAHVQADLLDHLAAQPWSIELADAGTRVLMTHATPFPPHEEYVWPHAAELRRMGELDVDVLVLGHTHQAMAVRVGTVLVVNPGSAGQPITRDGVSTLSCGALDTATGGFEVLTYPAVR